MDITNRITIDLTEFGLTGEIVMAVPSPRRDAWCKNQSMKHATIDPRTGRPDPTHSDVGDIEVLHILTFVKSAPFPIDRLESYYDYCDELDETNPGVAMKIQSAMLEAYLTLSKGEKSPLD